MVIYIDLTQNSDIHKTKSYYKTIRYAWFHKDTNIFLSKIISKDYTYLKIEKNLNNIKQIKIYKNNKEFKNIIENSKTFLIFKKIINKYILQSNNYTMGEINSFGNLISSIYTNKEGNFIQIREIEIYLKDKFYIIYLSESVNKWIGLKIGDKLPVTWNLENYRWNIDYNNLKIEYKIKNFIPPFIWYDSE